MAKPRPHVIQYREGSREDFGLLRIVHLSHLRSIETQVDITESQMLYSMRLSWRSGVPPLTGELISLHLPKSRIPARISRVTRTCVCCPQGRVHIYAHPIPGFLPDERVCDCAQRRETDIAAEWRDYGAETECRRRGRGVLREVSDILKSRKRGQP